MNTICNAYPVAGGGVLTVTLVTPDPATADHVRLLSGLALAAEVYQHDVAKVLHPLSGRTVPHACERCGTPDDKCNELVHTKGRACCARCHNVDTHGALVGQEGVRSEMSINDWPRVRPSQWTDEQRAHVWRLVHGGAPVPAESQSDTAASCDPAGTPDDHNVAKTAGA